jgi:hypothetical protein
MLIYYVDKNYRDELIDILIYFVDKDYQNKLLN